MWNVWSKIKACLTRWRWQQEQPLWALLPLPKPYLYQGQQVTFTFGPAEAIGEMLAVERLAYGRLWWRAEDFYFDMVGRQNSAYLLAYLDGLLLGFLACRKQALTLHISNFLLLPAWQGRGLGSYLLKEAKHYARRLHCVKLTLEVREGNVKAQAFYKKRGFFITGERENYYQQTGESAILLACLVTSAD